MAQVIPHFNPHPIGLHDPQDFPQEAHKMSAITEFAFPARVGTEQQDAHTLETPAVQNPSRSRTHRRAHTSAHGPSALPTFSFGSGSVEPPQMSSPGSVPLTSTGNEPAPVTATSRHRRVVSEFVGEKSDLSQPAFPSASLGEVHPAPSINGSRAVHRHRRSGAVSSQDLSAASVQRNALQDTALADPSIRDHKDDNDASASNALDVANDSSQDHSSLHQNSPTGLSRNVGFSDNVEVIPRPTSMVSSEGSDSHSTTRTKGANCEFDSSSSILDVSYASRMDEPSIPEKYYHSSGGSPVLGTGIDIVDLNENFDDDPTSCVTSPSDLDTHAQAGFEEMSTGPSSPSTPEIVSIDTSDANIDLDLASVDEHPSPPRSPAKGSSFQRARASMHSAGSQSGCIGPALINHRRTESAPALASMAFSSTSHEKAADAGFEMEDVFEEEEEADEACESPTCPSTSQAMQVESRAEEHDITPKAGPSLDEREIASSPSLLPAIQFDPPRATGKGRLPTDQEDEDMLHLPRPPFVGHDQQSMSSRSSPRYAHSAMSSNEPSPGFHQSVDDVPSLISSGSTVGSNAYATLPDQSSRSLEPGVAGSTSSLAPSNTGHRKRLSVMSLNVSRIFSNNTSRLEQAEPSLVPRSNSVTDIKPLSAPKKQRFRDGLRKFLFRRPSSRDT